MGEGAKLSGGSLHGQLLHVNLRIWRQRPKENF